MHTNSSTVAPPPAIDGADVRREGTTDMTVVTRTLRLARLALALALAVGTAASLDRPAAAVTSVGVTPTVAQVAMPAGETERRELTVSNEGDEPFAVTTGVTTLAGAPDDGSAVPWVTVEPGELELDPGEALPIEVSVDAPEGLASGGYYALVTLTTAAEAVDGAGAAVAGQLGVPIPDHGERDGVPARPGGSRAVRSGPRARRPGRTPGGGPQHWHHPHRPQRRDGADRG
jgi:hypothetical protein